MKVEKGQRDQAGAQKLYMSDLVNLIAVECKNNPTHYPDKIIFCQITSQKKHTIGAEKK